MALIDTIGGSTSDSYVSLTEANTFFNSHYLTAKQEAWSGLSSAQKEMALKRATQILDTLRVLDTEYGSGAMPNALVSYAGHDITIHRQMVGQRLQFPRNIDIDVDDEAFIPQNVKDAQCEQAIYLLSVDEATIATQLTGVKEESAAAGQARVRQEFRGQGSMIAPLALELMREYLRPTRRMQRA
jgi:hypothetical protein